MAFHITQEVCFRAVVEVLVMGEVNYYYMKALALDSLLQEVFPMEGCFNQISRDLIDIIFNHPLTIHLQKRQVYNHREKISYVHICIIVIFKSLVVEF